MKISIALLTLALSASHLAVAQTETPTAGAQVGQTVKLRVLVKGTGAPVGRAEVRVGGQKLFTDKNGEVSVKLPAGGSVELYRNSFEAQTVEVADLRGKDVVEIYLFPATPDDNEVMVRGAKRPEASRKTISIQEAVKVAPGGDPAQIPKLLPGVQSKGFRPDIVVRGSAPQDSLYFIDDFAVPYIFHRLGNFSIIPDQLLSDVEFSSGGFGVQYGDATGGVVTLRTKNEIPERAKTELRINVPFYSSIYHERPVNDGKDLFAVSARRSYLELFLPLVLKNSGADLTVSPYFGDGHAYWVHPTEDGHVKVLGLWADDGIKALFPTSASTTEDGRGNFNFRDTTTLLGLEWKKTLDKSWSLTVSPELLNKETRADFLGNNFDLGVNVVRTKAEATRRLEGKDKLYVGFEGSYAWVNYSILAPKPNYNDPFYDFESAPKVQSTRRQTFADGAVWAAIDENIGRLTLTPGVRAFYSTQLSRSNADPRLAARYQLTERQALKAAVGQYSEVPQPQDTDPNFGNPHLKYIRAYHYILGIETEWSEQWHTDFQVYYKDTVELVRSNPTTNTDNSGSLVSSGFEAFIRRNLTERLFGWISYTYSRTRERDKDAETFRESEYDETHVLQATGNYKLTAVWDIGGRLLYHTGDTFTGVDYSTYNADLDKYQQHANPDARPYSQRLPPYHEIDIFADKDWLYDTWTMTLRFGVEYLALQRPAQGVQYNYDYTTKEYFKGVPPIPYIELRAVL